MATLTPVPHRRVAFLLLNEALVAGQSDNLYAKGAIMHVQHAPPTPIETLLRDVLESSPICTGSLASKMEQLGYGGTCQIVGRLGST